jgi:hypothetical protein
MVTINHYIDMCIAASRIRTFLQQLPDPEGVREMLQDASSDIPRRVILTRILSRT